MRKRIVYMYNDTSERLNDLLRSTTPKTLLYQKIRLNIAFNELRIAIFDPSGRYTSLYNLDKFYESINNDGRK